MIRKLEHVGINVTDMERSLRFYQDVFGLVLRSRVRIAEQVELAFLHHPEQPDMEVELVAAKSPEAREGLVNHLAFRVDDLAAELARFKELGIELVDSEPRVLLDGAMKIAFFQGPDGEKLELVER